ncbi:MAG TPA: hypothetical protein PLC17_10240 [Tenuifilaceae bacterium]|nr:hypothetical protein [Tenuifilaceae bacterium]HQB79058.1 hypothetical protein [Tenuifilaceae bacterium]
MEVLKLIGIVVVLLAVGFAGMAIRIMFHKSHKFPETSAGHNKDMRKLGIKCAKQEEMKCWSKKGQSGCTTCFEHARD